MGQLPLSLDQQRIALCHVLKHARTKAGFKQVDLAARLSVTQSYVSKYEAGNRRLDLFELLAVCDVLGIELGTVLAEVRSELTRGVNIETGQPFHKKE